VEVDRRFEVLDVAESVAMRLIFWIWLLSPSLIATSLSRRKQSLVIKKP